MGIFMTATQPFHTSVDVDAPFRTQLKQQWMELKGSAKQWTRTGAIFAGTYTSYECLVDSYRARHDWISAAWAGGLTGATVAIRTGVKPMLWSAIGMSAFSILLEYIQSKIE